MTTKFYLTCIFLCATCIINAQPSAALLRADSLFSRGAYFEASVAYERVLFNKSHTEEDRAINQKIQCLKQQGQFAQAIQFIRANLHENGPDSLEYRLYYEQALCTYLAGNFENALSVAEQIKLLYPSHAAEAKLLLLQLLSLNELQQWKQASQVYNALLSRYQPTDSALSPYTNLPRLKSKDRAQWLSTLFRAADSFMPANPGSAGDHSNTGSRHVVWHCKLSAALLPGCLAGGCGLIWFISHGWGKAFGGIDRAIQSKKAVEFNKKIKEAVLKIVAAQQ